jgi:site-specific DNA recombinase
MAFAGYIRVSDVGGRNGDSFISPDVQRETIERLAQSRGLELGETVQELDVSGGKSIDSRELGRLVREVEAGELEGIIVWKVSRFSRNQLDAVQVLDRIDRAGGRLLAEDFDSAAPMAKAMRGLMSGLAEEERDQRREGWKQAKLRAVERGVFPGRTPYGYQRAEDRTLVPHPEQSETVREIFRLRAEGSGYSAICRALNVPSPTGGSQWPTQTVLQMLRNRIYLGEVTHGSHTTENAHEALVSPTEFDLAQTTRSSRPRRERPASADALLHGIAHCAGCGHKLKILQNTNGTQVRYYCKDAECKEPCPAKAYAAVKDLDAYAEEWFLNELRGVNPIATALEAHEQIALATHALEQAEAQLREFAVKADAADSFFAEAYDSRKMAVEAARSDLAQARSAARPIDALPDGSLLDAWPTLDIADKRRIIASVVDEVRLSGKARDGKPMAERVQFVRDSALIESQHATVSLTD